MISATVEYSDYNNKPVKKKFYFNLNKAELTKFQYRKDGTMFTDVLLRIADSKTNTREVVDMVEDIFSAAIGKRSEDGTRFIKNDEVRSEFFDTDAYSALLFKILEDPKYMAKLFEGMIPKDLASEARKKSKGNLDEYDREKLLEMLREYKQPGGETATPVESAD